MSDARNPVSESDSPVAQISQHTARGPACVAFLRHAGCPFLSRDLEQLSQARGALDAMGIQLVLVCLWAGADTDHRFDQAGLDGVPRVCDPAALSYRWAGLRRAGLWEVAGPRVWWPAIKAMLSGHLPRIPRGDVRQLPGLALVQDGQIVARHASRTSFGLPDPAVFCRKHLNALGR